MSKEKDEKLDNILSEINSGIKKSKALNESQSVKESDNASKVANIQKNDEHKSFIDTAKIIEKEPDSMDILYDKKSRHIEVTAGEEVEKGKSGDGKETSKSPSKNISKSDLKKKNGTAVARHHERKKSPSKKQKRIAIFGVLITFFVIVGVISTIWTGVRVTSNMINNTSLKEELAYSVFPLVIVDIPEFESPTKLDNTAIISSSIWGFIIDEKDKSKYKKDDLGSIYVPDVDIEKYIRQIYGPNVKIEHQSVDDSSVQMTYDAESKYYVIESTPKFLPYTPRVDKITKTGDILTLRVSYILPNVMWDLKSDKRAAAVDKVMEYKVKKKDDKYEMISVKLIEVASSPETGQVKSEKDLADEGIVEDEPVTSDETVSK